MNPDMNEERIGLAKLRVTDMLAIADALEIPIGLEEVRSAALVALPPAAERFAAWALNMAQQNMWAATLILAGPDALGIDFASLEEKSSPKALPAHRPRRPRPSAADRARATEEWLAGPAWDIVDPDRNSYPTDGAP